MDPEKTTKLITKHEGKDPWVYQDSKGIWTIGIGRNVDADHRGPGLRNEEMELMLSNDIQDTHLKLQNLIIGYDLLSPIRQAVLIDMAHNLGLYGLRKFRQMFFDISKQNWPGASREMLDSLWARQVGNRAIELSKMMLTDTWPEDL